MDGGLCHKQGREARAPMENLPGSSAHSLSKLVQAFCLISVWAYDSHIICCRVFSSLAPGGILGEAGTVHNSSCCLTCSLLSQRGAEHSQTITPDLPRSPGNAGPSHMNQQKRTQSPKLWGESNTIIWSHGTRSRRPRPRRMLKQSR